jgi:hypothetical protein
MDVCCSISEQLHKIFDGKKWNASYQKEDPDLRSQGYHQYKFKICNLVNIWVLYVGVAQKRASCLVLSRIKNY